MGVLASGSTATATPVTTAGRLTVAPTRDASYSVASAPHVDAVAAATTGGTGMPRPTASSVSADWMMAPMTTACWTKPLHVREEVTAWRRRR